MNDKIKVLIVDDHPVFRYGLRSLLSQDEDIEVVGEAGQAALAMEAVRRDHPEIVLLDIRMPGPTGIELAQQLHNSNPEIKVIILTAFENEDYLLQAMEAGVYAYLYKNSASDILTRAIHCVHNGQKLLNPDQVNLVLQKLSESSQQLKVNRYNLTDMELEILAAMSRGDTYSAISQNFYLSEATVKRMVATIQEKLDASNRTQAVAIAIRDGLI